MNVFFKSLPLVASLIAAEIAAAETIKPDDFRNLYGIVWTGTPSQNLEYACQMGYTHVFYQAGMEKNPKSKGLKFFIESPEYSVYPRLIDTEKTYSPEQIKWWETHCSLISLEKPFPWNIAPGWRIGKKFTATLDLQQKSVIKETVAKIVDRVKRIEAKNPDFKFAGFAWDVPQPPGDFWDGSKDDWFANGSQVTLSRWTGKDSGIKHPDVVHDYPTHKLGHYEFYRRLFERCRKEKNPDSKFIVEPYNVYGGWIKDIEEDLLKTKGLEETKKYLPDFVCSEGSGTEFVEDPRVTKSGLYKKNQVSSSTPNVYDELNARKIAATAAINGAWTHWYGRPGATGNMPDYKTIRDVPARLKLSKVIPVWENINNTPLSERKWDGKTYSSPTAFMDKNGLGALQPQTQKFFFVFNSDKAKVPIPAG